MKITLIGHSTVLVEIGGARVLTDPFFGVRGHIAYKRLAPPGQSREELVEVDVVLVSHNHWDHVDRRYFRSLSPDVPVLAPGRVAWLTRAKGARGPRGMRPWDSHTVAGVTVTAVPALHMAVTLGYVLQADEGQVYFAGDTYYRPFMKEIGERFELDVALLPVTTFRVPMTMGESGAVRAVRDLRASVVIPIHLGVTPRSPLLRTGHSPEGFARRAREAGLDCRVVVLAEGESWAPS